MLKLRGYQETAVASVLARWGKARAVLLCAPMGSGKTVMGAEAVRRSGAKRVLWIAHRRELVEQAAEKLRAITGSAVGVIGPGPNANEGASIQVATVQTLLARGTRPPADLLVFDEAHHYISEDWKTLVGAYPGAKRLGLTATPERSDGRPLGDIFDDLVVAASYSQLVSDGHLVPCRVFRPSRRQGRALAEDPVDAYERLAPGSRAFVFVQSVEAAHQLAAKFCIRRIPAATIEAKTPREEREQHLAEFAEGKLSVLTNVYALTEGVDVPAATTCILARGCEHVSPYLQMCGRVLRPHPGKTEAVLIDLVGASLKHGVPVEDRQYSLRGKGISRGAECPRCGDRVLLYPCAGCGYSPPAAWGASPNRPPSPEILRRVLEEIYGGADCTADAKKRMYQELRAVQLERAYKPAWIVLRYKERFGEEPVLTGFSGEERLAEYRRLEGIGRERGYKPGYAAARFKQMFGGWPPWEWRQSA